MNRLFQIFSVMSVIMVLSAQAAFADEGSAVASATPGVEKVIETPVAPTIIEPMEYPLVPYDRPSFLPRSAFEARIKADYENAKAHKLGGSVGLSYGITDKFQIDIDFDTVSAYAFNDDTKEDWKKGYDVGNKLKLKARHGIWSNDFMSVKVGASMPVFFDSRPVKEASLFVPLSFAPVHGMGIQTFHKDLIKLKFDGKSPFSAEFVIPLKVGYQIGKRVWVEAETKLATFTAGGAGDKGVTQVVGAPKLNGKTNKTNLDLSATVAVTNWFDIEPSVSFENIVVSSADELARGFSAGLGFTFRGGWLNG